MKKSLPSNNAGVAAIEFALILPILILMMLGILEFGVYFVKSQFVQRTVSGIANSVQLNAVDTVNIRNTAMGSGGTMVTYDDSANAFFCAKSYATLAAAQLGQCIPTDWLLAKPADATGSTYYVAIQASV
jgi:Flp pilus assembly pilin Flp